MKITCEDNHGCYRCSLGENKASKIQAYLGWCVLDWALEHNFWPGWWLSQGYVLSKRTNCLQLCRVNEIKLHTCDYTVDFHLYNQVFFTSRNLNILFGLLSCLSFPEFQKILLWWKVDWKFPSKKFSGKNIQNFGFTLWCWPLSSEIEDKWKKVLFSTYYNMEFSLLSESDSAGL